MRVLFLTTSYPSPFEPTKGTFNRALVAALGQAHDVRVVVPVPWPVVWGLASGSGWPAAATGAAAVPRGPVPVFPTYFYTPKVLRRFYGSFLWYSVRGTVRRLLQDFRPEVVLGYWSYPDGEVAVRAARMAGVPAVVMVGGSDVLLLTRDPERRRLVVRALQSADAVLAVGADVRQRIGELGIPLERVHLFARGVDENVFSPGDRAGARARLGLPPDPLLLWVGRMVPVKGLDVLIDACVRLKRGPLGFRLYLVGDGPLRQSLMARVKAEGLEEQVRFAGPVPHEQLGDWYRAADLTVLPSRSEGVPNVLLESLACGTPFVASRVGGVAGLARNPELDLVPPEDPDALASAIVRALRSPAGRETGPARRFDWAESVASLEAVLRPTSGTEVPHEHRR
ncbi:MAG TPA: glycosyltransferase [Vicinamibacteria bacterium]|nr:glycosyltransferase [Vicinamibacteria bacterium]